MKKDEFLKMINRLNNKFIRGYMKRYAGTKIEGTSTNEKWTAKETFREMVLLMTQVHPKSAKRAKRVVSIIRDIMADATWGEQTIDSNTYNITYNNILEFCGMKNCVSSQRYEEVSRITSNVDCKPLDIIDIFLTDINLLYYDTETYKAICELIIACDGYDVTEVQLMALAAEIDKFMGAS